MHQPITRIALVGHCGFDQFMLRRALGKIAGHVQIITVSDAASLRNSNDVHTLLLINRKLDGLFETDSGIELIRQLAASETPPAMMLVSDISHAQHEAEKAGAQPGFGKSQLGWEVMHDRLKAVLDGAG